MLKQCHLIIGRKRFTRLYPCTLVRLQELETSGLASNIPILAVFNVCSNFRSSSASTRLHIVTARLIYCCSVLSISPRPVTPPPLLNFADFISDCLHTVWQGDDCEFDSYSFCDYDDFSAALTSCGNPSIAAAFGVAVAGLVAAAAAVFL